MPNFQDRVIQGNGTRGNVGTYKAESLPNITGGIHIIDRSIGNPFPTGAIYSNIETNNWSTWTTESTNVAGNFIFDASISSSTYQDSAPVQQNALLIQCCIKY